MLLYLLFAAAISASEEDGGAIIDEGDDNLSVITVDISNGTTVREYTNTIMYQVVQTSYTTYTNLNGVNTMTVTHGEHIVYVPTLLQYLRVVYEATATPIPLNTPMATQARKSIILHPGILIGCTFGVIFIIGVVYTGLCRSPVGVTRPKARLVKKGSKDNSDSFEKAKKRRRMNKRDQQKGVTFSLQNIPEGGINQNRKRPSRPPGSQPGPARSSNKRPQQSQRSRPPNSQHPHRPQ